MADRTESSIEIGASPQAVLDVIADFAAYPEWTGTVKQAEVIESGPDGRGRRVRFVLDAGAIRDTYVLDYSWQVSPDGTGRLSWTLVESTVLRALDGHYELIARGFEGGGEGGGPKTASPVGSSVRYALSVDLRMPMLGMLRRKAEKVIVDTALNELKKRVEGQWSDY